MKLFLKIFLWFLAAIALMVGVVMFITKTFQTEPTFGRWQRGARAQLSVYSATASQIYDQEGEAALRQFMSRLKDAETLLEVDLLDRDGRLFYGDATNIREFDTVIARTLASGTAELDVTTKDTPLGATSVKFADGQSYLLLIRWEPSRAPSLFFDSWLGYLRLAGLLVTVIVVCYALALYLTSPIRKLREATQKLAEGDLETRVAPRVGRRRDELADLALDFDIMAERIGSLITSQQRLARDISHELRSPLARLNVALEIAKQKAGGESEPLLERIETESNRLNDMISRLLTLSRLESGAVDVDRVRVDLAELVRDVAADAEFEAQAKGKFVQVLSADACNVEGSEDLLRSAIENVLRNAIRYTPDRSVVEVSLAANNGKAVLKVVDKGGGVPEDELPNLFRPFYRIGESRERRTGGSGLGLAIAERAIKAHKGTITARNANGGLTIEIGLNTASRASG
jgi:two-component system, OmpR family, sensor histidine kinase CpxA